MKPDDDYRLKITLDNGEIWIRGNKPGLEYLSKVSAQIIGKTDPSGHIHIMPELGNATIGSKKARIEYSDDPNDYK